MVFCFFTVVRGEASSKRPLVLHWPAFRGQSRSLQHLRLLGVSGLTRKMELTNAKNSGYQQLLRTWVEPSGLSS